MKISNMIAACALTIMTSSAFAGWNDSSPVITPNPSPYQPCDQQCMRDSLRGWNDRGPVITPHPAPYQPCDQQCMRDSLGGFNDQR
jgi:hypothetical protein